MILVYCDHITPRHRFTFDFIFGAGEKGGCRLSDDPVAFLAEKGPKFSYSANRPDEGIHFAPSGLLEESGVRPQDIQMTSWRDLPVFFPVRGNECLLPFDPFAMVFYLVTRYEEYLDFRPDAHGRFPASASLACREGFLHRPLADEASAVVRGLIHDKYPGAIPEPEPFRFRPTFDIDIAFAHLGKGFPRALAAWARLLLGGKTDQVRERWSVVTGKLADPYDNFGLHREWAVQDGLEPKYFFLLGDFGRHDRNNSYRNERFRRLIREVAHHAETGIHPSYRSHLDAERIRLEMERLSEITGRPVTSSRFHFLRLKLPDSYRILMQLGITDDHSMGYSTVNGFRAGTARAVYFYDLMKDERTALRIHPFIFMDTAMADHLGMSSGEALDEIRRLLSAAGPYGGEAIGIWHNYALSETGNYRGWRQVLHTVFTEPLNPTM